MGGAALPGPARLCPPARGPPLRTHRRPARCRRVCRGRRRRRAPEDGAATVRAPAARPAARPRGAGPGLRGASHGPGVLRHQHRRRGRGPDRVRPVRRGGPPDGAQLRGARQGRRQRPDVRGLVLPPRRQEVHGARRGHCERRWHRLRQHLRGPLRGRDVRHQAQRPGHPEHGERREGLQRVPVLHHHHQHPLAGRQAHRVRQGDRRPGRGAQDRAAAHRLGGPAPQARRRPRLRRHPDPGALLHLPQVHVDVDAQLLRAAQLLHLHPRLLPVHAAETGQLTKGAKAAGDVTVSIILFYLSFVFTYF